LFAVPLNVDIFVVSLWGKIISVIATFQLDRILGKRHRDAYDTLSVIPESWQRSSQQRGWQQTAGNTRGWHQSTGGRQNPDWQQTTGSRQDPDWQQTTGSRRDSGWQQRSAGRLVVQQAGVRIFSGPKGTFCPLELLFYGSRSKFFPFVIRCEGFEFCSYTKLPYIIRVTPKNINSLDLLINTGTNN
jgi:hypothetical protein